MPRDEDVGSQSLHRIQHSNPGHTVSSRHIGKFFGKEHLAHIRDPVLRDEQDAVSLCVRRPEIEDLNLLAAEVQCHTVVKCRVWQPRALLFGREAAALHLIEQAGTIVFVTDLEHIGIGKISFTEGIVERRGNQIANGLLDDTGDRFPFRSRNGFRLQGVEHQHSFACHDHAAVEQSACIVDGVHVVTGNDLPQGAGTRRPIGDGRLRGNGAV